LLTVVGDFCDLGSPACGLLALLLVVLASSFEMPSVNNVLAANAPTAPTVAAAAAENPTAVANAATEAAMAVKIGILCGPGMFYWFQTKA
jgi:hypothetical protein